MIIRKATESDLDAIERIYDEIHTEEEAGRTTTGWKRGIYPVRKTAEDALSRDDLFVLAEDDVLYGTGIINDVQVDCYRQGEWEHHVPEENICVLHTLVISPTCAGKGYGKAFVKYYENYARGLKYPELRLDTNATNTVARKMYGSLGFREVGIVDTVFNGIPGVHLVLLEKYLGEGV